MAAHLIFLARERRPRSNFRRSGRQEQTLLATSPREVQQSHALPSSPTPTRQWFFPPALHLLQNVFMRFITISHHILKILILRLYNLNCA